MATPRQLGYRQPSLLGYRQQGPTWSQDQLDALAIQRAGEDRGSNSLVQGWQSTSAGLNAGDLAELAQAAEQAGDTEQAKGLLRRMRVAQQVGAAQGPDTRSVEDVWKDPSRVANWAGGALGSMARSAAPAVAAGAVGAGAGALMGGIPGAVAGGLRGLVTYAPAAAVSYDQLRGENVAAQYDDAEVMKRSADERAQMASVTAALQTIPEMIVPMRAVGAMIGRGTTPAARAAAKAVQNRPLDVLKDTVIEAGTETLQTELGYQGLQALGSIRERNPMDYWNAAAAGAVGGGGLSGASNVLGAVGDKIATLSQPVAGESSDAEMLRGTVGKVQQFMQDLQTEPVERAVAKLITPDRVLADDLQGADPETMAAAIKQHDLTAGASAEETVASLLQQDRFSDRDKAQLAGLQGKMEDPVNRAQLGVLMGKNRLQEVASATLEVVTGAIKRGVGAVKSRFSMEGMDTSPLVDALAPVFGEEAPATAQKWIELASKFEGIASAEAIADPALAQSLETMADALDTMESKVSIRKGLKAVGLTSMVKLIDELQSVPGAKADLKKPDSFLRVMLQKRHERVFPSAAARKVDLLAPTYAAMSEKKQDAYAEALSLAFGSKEAAKAVLGHYAKLFETTRKGFEGQTNALPPNAGSSFERPSQAEAEALAGGLTEGDFANQKASYRDANPARPFFAMSDRKELKAEAAKGGLVAGMDEYVRRTGRSAAEAFGRVKTDLEQRLKASRNRDKGWLTAELERAVATGAKLRTRQDLEKRLAKAEVRTDLPKLERQYAKMLRDAPAPEDMDPKRFDKALSRYRVVLRDENDTQASDEDVHRFQRLLRVRKAIKPPRKPKDLEDTEAKADYEDRLAAYEAKVGAIDETTVTFTTTDGKKLKTSAESMAYASQVKGGDLQKFLSAVSSMLDRNDIAGVDLPSTLVVFREGEKRKRRTLAEMRGIAKVRKQLQARAESGNPKQKAFAEQALALIDASVTQQGARETAVLQNTQLSGKGTRRERAVEESIGKRKEARDDAARDTAIRAQQEAAGVNEESALQTLITGTHPRLSAARRALKENPDDQQLQEEVANLRSEERVLSEMVRNWLDKAFPLPDRQEYTSRLADDVQMEGDYTEQELQAAYLDEVVGVLEQRLAAVRPELTKAELRKLYELNNQISATKNSKQIQKLTDEVDKIASRVDPRRFPPLVKSLQSQLADKKDELNQLMDSAGRNPRDGSRRVKDNPSREPSSEVQAELDGLAQSLMSAELDPKKITLMELSFQGKIDELRKRGGADAAEMLRAYQFAMGRLRRIKGKTRGQAQVEFDKVTGKRKDANPISYVLGPDGKPQALPLDPDTAYAVGDPDGSATKKGDRLIGPLQPGNDGVAEAAKQRMDAIVPNATGADPATEVGRNVEAQDHAARARAQRASRVDAKPAIDAIQAQVMKAREKQRTENASKEDDRLAPGAKDGAGIMKKIPDGPKAKFASTVGEIQAEQTRQRAREEQVSKVVDTLVETLRGMLTTKSEGRASEAKPGLTEQRAAERAADTQALIERLERLKALEGLPPASPAQSRARLKMAKSKRPADKAKNFEEKMQARKAAALARTQTKHNRQGGLTNEAYADYRDWKNEFDSMQDDANENNHEDGYREDEDRDTQREVRKYKVFAANDDGEMREYEDGEFEWVPKVEKPKWLFHGTRASESVLIDADGDLILKPSKNFGGKTNGVSFTDDINSAKDYATRIKGGGPKGFTFEGAKIIRIDSAALSNVEEEAMNEWADYSGMRVVIPKGSYSIEPVARDRFFLKDSYLAAGFKEYVRDNYRGLEREAIYEDPASTQEAYLSDIVDAADSAKDVTEAKNILRDEFGHAYPGAAQPKQNAQSVGGTAVPTTFAELQAKLEKMRGPNVKLAVTQLLSGYGKYERTVHGPLVKRLITIAHAAPNKMSVLYHEALHDFFAELGKDPATLRIKQQLLDAASTGHVQAQLRELLKGEPAALAQLSDPEERLAYMFQFRMANPEMMRIGPNTDTLFKRIAAAIRKFTGMITELEKAEQILLALYDGRLADPSTAAKVMAEWNTIGDTFQHYAGPIKQAMEKVFSASTEQLRAMNVPALNTIADLFENNAKKSGLLTARAQSVGVWRKKLDNVLEGHDEKEIQAAMVHLQSMKDPVTDLQNKLAKFFKDIRDWQIKKGVLQFTGKFVPTGQKDANGAPIIEPEYKPMGLVKRYFPRVVDLDMITKKGPEFSRLLQKHMGYSQKQADDVLHQLRVGDQMTVKPQGVTKEASFSPYAQSVISRELILDEAGATALAEAGFWSQDFAGVMTRYIDHAVHRAEYTERFGNIGEKLDAMMGRAKEEGATDAQLERAKRLISGLDGTIHRDMNPTIKQIQMALLTLQNLILLPLAVFSQLIDPLGVAVRSGDVRDAGAAYKRVLTDITQWASPKPDRAREMAEIIGAVQKDSVLQAMGMVHNGMYMSAGLRKINNFIFKYNGMQGINNSFRTAAVTAAEKYILEHRNDARRMEELDLTPADITESKPGEIDYTSEKIQQALFRFADGAVVRPNAAHRPLWMSDPRFMLVAHLKQFAFSFQQVILKRVAHEASYGNSGPLKILAMYAPIMIAADMAKWALTGNLPQNWSLLHLFAHGVHRSGLLGVGTFGADVVNDVVSERSAVLGFLGPTAQHLGLLASWIGGGVPVEDVIDRSVPLARLFTK